MTLIKLVQFIHKNALLLYSSAREKSLATITIVKLIFYAKYIAARSLMNEKQTKRNSHELKTTQKVREHNWRFEKAAFL